MVEEYTFWELAYHFVREENYRVLHLSKEQNELWLENPDSKQAPFIRLVNHALDWSNWVERDIQTTGYNGEKIRKQTFKKGLHILNIYISPYPPVDDYEHLIKQTNKFDHTIVQSIIMAKSTYNDAIADLQSNFTKKINMTNTENKPLSTELVEEIKRNTLQMTFNKIQEEKSLFSFGKPIFTYIFMALQVIVFILLELKGGSENTATLIQFGAKYNPLILEGEWWRFFAPIFIHIGFLHLLMNTLGLYYLGTAVERIYGSARFFWIYLFAGFIGSVASFMFSPNLSAGASGAIYGCFGALLYLGLVYPKLFFRTLGRNVIVVLLLNIAIGFSIPNIDQAGHFGGLIGGFIATGMVDFPKRRKFLRQFLFLCLGIIITISSLYYGYHKPLQFQSEASIIQLAQEYINDKKYDETYSLLTEFGENSKNLSEHYYFQLSYVEIQKGMFEEAKNHLNKAVQLNTEFHEAHYNLAILLLQFQETEKAKEHVLKAIELAPQNKNYQELLNKINSYIQSVD